MKSNALHHVSLPIFVTNTRCPECERLIPYDGADGSANAIFCVSKHDTFTRELLDAWFYDVCGVGSSFRDAFSSRLIKSCISRAKLHEIGTQTTLN